MIIFVINLDRSKDRFQSIKSTLEKFSIPFKRVSAVDANLVSETELSKNTISPNLRYPRLLTKGEIACFKSHQLCWKQLIDSGENWGIILEDNCQFSPLAKEYLSSTNWIPEQCQLVHLSYGSSTMYYRNKIFLDNGNCLIKTEFSSPIGTSAYIMSRQAAIKALDQSKYIYEPVDNFLFGMYSDFAKNVACWRTLHCIIKRAPVETVITGRYRNHKTKVRNSSRLSLHPQRLINKLIIKTKRMFLSKTKQIWLDG